MSADGQDKNDRFRKDLDLPFPVVGDPAGHILRGYGVRWPLLGLARRTTYVIGSDRRIRLAHRAELDVESHIGQAVAAVESDRNRT